MLLVLFEFVGIFRAHPPYINVRPVLTVLAVLTVLTVLTVQTALTVLTALTFPYSFTVFPFTDSPFTYVPFTEFPFTYFSFTDFPFTDFVLRIFPLRVSPLRFFPLRVSHSRFSLYGFFLYGYSLYVCPFTVFPFTQRDQPSTSRRQAERVGGRMQHTHTSTAEGAKGEEAGLLQSKNPAQPNPQTPITLISRGGGGAGDSNMQHFSKINLNQITLKEISVPRFNRWPVGREALYVTETGLHPDHSKHNVN